MFEGGFERVFELKRTVPTQNLSSCSQLEINTLDNIVRVLEFLKAPWATSYDVDMEHILTFDIYLSIDFNELPIFHDP